MSAHVSQNHYNYNNNHNQIPKYHYEQENQYNPFGKVIMNNYTYQHPVCNENITATQCRMRYQSYRQGTTSALKTISNNIYSPLKTPVSQLHYSNKEKLRKPNYSQINLKHKDPSEFLKNKLLYNKYIVTKRVGRGTFGDIWGCADKTTHRLYAIKMVKRDTSLNTEKRKKHERMILWEGKQIRKLNKIETKEEGKKFIIKTRELLYTNRANKENSNIFNKLNGLNVPIGPCIVLELCGYSLLHYMAYHESANLSISFEAIRVISSQLFSAMKFIHGIGGMVHADIKPENILIASRIANTGLDHSVQIKIIDFGNAIPVRNKVSSFNVQTLWYRAPEVLFGNRNEISVFMDMWSIGCVLCELFSVNIHHTFRRMFGCKKWTVEHVLNKIYHELGSFPVYVYNEFKSYHPQATLALNFHNESSYIKLKQHRKYKLIQKLAVHVNNGTLINHEFIDLVACLLDSNPLTRYSSEDAIKHAFIKENMSFNHQQNECHSMINVSTNDDRQNRINQQIKEYQQLQNTNIHNSKPIFPEVMVHQHLY